MQAVVEMPHIKVNIQGKISSLMIEVLKKEYGKNLILHEKEQSIPLRQSVVWNNIQNKKNNPAQNLKILRKNRNLTQKQLGDYVGVLKGRISEYERNVTSISKSVAKKMAKELGTSIENFI